MIKNIIKIGIPLLVLGGIVIALVLTQKSIDDGFAFQHIDQFDFESYVNQYVDSILNEPNVLESNKKYEEIYDIIETESSITVKKSSGKEPLLSSMDANSYYVQIFEAYYNIFERDADALFGSATWKKVDRDRIKNEVPALKKKKGTSSKHVELDKYYRYATGYDHAMGLKKCSCKDKNDYDRYCNLAKTYACKPYSNNSDLKNIEQDVRTSAKKTWGENIKKEVDDICGTTYTNREDFDEKDAAIRENLGEYRRVINNNTWGVELTDKLDKKRDQLNV